MTVENNNKFKKLNIEQKIEDLKKTCQNRGLRITQQRIEIFKEVAESCEHPDAEMIYERVKAKLPNVSIDTVYRTLASLEEMDMIFRVDNQLPRARFDADKTPHHHFLCTKCNAVYDIFPDALNSITLPENLELPGKIKNINLQIRGICKNCLEKNKY